MMGLQAFALQDAEPNFDLIEPGGVGRQPADLEVEWRLERGLELLQPAFQLFRGMSRAVVQDESDRGHFAAHGFGHNDLLDKGLEIDKALAGAASPVDAAIGHTQACKQVAGTSPMVARCVQLGFASQGRTWLLFTLTGLDRRFFVEGQEPGSFSQQGSSAGIEP